MTDLDDRHSLSRVTAGIGYEIFDTDRTTWNVSGGPAYQMTTFDSVSEGEDGAVDTPAFITSTSIDFDLTKDIELECDYKAMFTDAESGRYTHHTVVGLDFDLTRRLDFNVSWVRDRTEKPAANSEGVVSEKDDFRLSIGLGWDF